MKSKLKLIGLLGMLTIFFPMQLFSQGWTWDWANSNTQNGRDSWMDMIHSDFLNNNYCRTPYDTAIYFTDTSFFHPEQYPGYGNYAISKYGPNGNFINALDLYTLPGDDIQYVEMLSDIDLNIYLCAPFTKRIFVNDTFINIAATPYPWQPDVFIAKFNPDYNLIWAGLISSNLQDDLRGFAMSDDNHIYIATVHMANSDIMQVNYLNQDTSMTYSHTMNSLTKIDLDGNLIWNREIRCEFTGSDTRDLTIGDNGLIYLQGSAFGDISINEDTIYFPNNPQNITAKFLLTFDQDGTLVNGFFFDWDIWQWELRFAENNDMYVSGSIMDTAIIGTDTVIVPEGSYYGVLGKFDSQLNPIWYQVFESNSISRIFIENENLLFMLNGKGNFQIADTVFNIGNYYEVILGEFSPTGQLLNIKTTHCSNDIVSGFCRLDNCGDFIVGGYFTGTAIFSSDTVFSNYNSIDDGFIAKLTRSEPEQINIGSDISACEEYTISSPSGYLYYQWNDSVSNQNWLTVTESGTYYFACANENGCWLYDTINVIIHPGFEISLGADTTIKTNDTIILSLPDLYESYFWSDGSTSNSLVILGEDYGIGTFPVWVEITDGPCIETDTLYLTVKSEFGINEVSKNTIHIFPNPAKKTIKIINPSKTKIKAINIYDPTGQVILQKEAPVSTIDISMLRTGLYFVEVELENGNVRRKLIVE